MEEQKASKKKLLLIPLALVVLGIVVVAVMIKTVSVTVNVSESISTSTVGLNFDIMPGEMYVQNVSVTNTADVPVSVQFSYAELNNSDEIQYKTEMPFIRIINPGTFEVPINITIFGNSSLGSLYGEVLVERI